MRPVAELLVPGDEITFRLYSWWVARIRVVEADERRLSAMLVGGCLRQLWCDSVLADVGDHTLITDSVRWATRLGDVADVLLFRRVVLGMLARRLAAVRDLAESWTSRPVVVGTAVIHNGKVLAQQRAYPARDAGRWELPGGRVEPGETERDAVIRECKEELGVAVVPIGRVGTDVPLGNGMLLRIHTAELADSFVAPKAVEHRAVRWVGRREADGLDWLDADRVLLPSLRGSLC